MTRFPLRSRSSVPIPAGATVLDLGSARSVLDGGRGHALIGGVPVLILRVRRGLVAVRNLCPHRGMPLTEATRRGRYLRCPFHGREYDIASGTGKCRTGGDPLPVYPCWLSDGHVFLAMP